MENRLAVLLKSSFLELSLKFKFKTHIENLCRKASFKLYALRRICKFIDNKDINKLINNLVNQLIQTFVFIKIVYILWLQKFIKALCTLIQSLFYHKLQQPQLFHLRKENWLLIPPAKSVNLGICLLTFRKSLLWNNRPLRLKIVKPLMNLNLN